MVKEVLTNKGRMLKARPDPMAKRNKPRDENPSGGDEYDSEL
jgi:hypothetical protein